MSTPRARPVAGMPSRTLKLHVWTVSCFPGSLCCLFRVVPVERPTKTLDSRPNHRQH